MILNWSPVAFAAAFEIEVDANLGSGFQPFTNTPGDVYSLDLTGYAVPAKYRVRAVVGDNKGPWSNEVVALAAPVLTIA